MSPAIEVRNKQILVDGRPRIVVAGEVHYFRVARAEWEQRLDLAVEAGCTTIASYLPWVFHELPDGAIDVTGATRPERDIAAFIDLCADRGLWFIARPGPFVMAELKNEGIPYRVYRDHPEVVPVGWDGVPAPTRTLDYLAPAFLDETARWFDAVLPPIAERLVTRGGPVIGVQLDNEVGMLAWVSNSPDLTDGLLADLAAFVSARHGGPGPYPVAPGAEGWAAAVRSPGDAWAGPLRVDLEDFMRERFAEYIAALRGMAADRGIDGVPLFINIHGTEAAGGEPFPIGISQLVRTYSGVPGMVAGSDHYLGEASLTTMTDLYVMNAFMDAVNDSDQPLTSLEFEAGTGDYGGGADQQYDPSSVQLKTRLCLAQGNRLVNYYLLAGGINPPLDEIVDDGNDRLSFTGERHGTAAPIDPEGHRGFGFEATRLVAQASNANDPWLSRMREDHDDVQLGLVLDAYATEYHYPASELMSDVVADLRAYRGAGQRRALARSLLLGGYRFGAVHLEERDPSARVLMVGLGRYVSRAVQERVARFATEGGSVLLLGRVPSHDLDGSPCSVLADALAVRSAGISHDSSHYFPSAVARSWLAPWPETRVAWREELVAERGETVLTDVYGAVCGVDVQVGDGRVVLLTAGLPSSRELFSRIMSQLGARPGLRVGTRFPGLFATTTTAPDTGERLVHLLNTSGAEVEVDLGLDAEPLVTGPLLVPSRSGHMLPLRVRVAGAEIAWATAEVVAHGDGWVELGHGLGADSEAATTAVLAPGTAVDGGPDARVSQDDAGRVVVTSPQRSGVRLRIG